MQHDVLVICDEVYEHLTFDDAEHLPLASFPGMRERTVRISSAGKTFSATGWKIGWALATPELINEITAVKQFLSYVSGAPFQPAVARALNEGDEWVEKARLDLQDRRDQLAAGLRSIGLEPILPRGTYFMTTDVRPLGYTDGVEFCRELPPAAESSRFPIRCSTTGQRPGDRTCAGPSASRSRCLTKRSAGWALCAMRPKRAHERRLLPSRASRAQRSYRYAKCIWPRPGSGDCSASSSLKGAESASSWCNRAP